MGDDVVDNSNIMMIFKQGSQGSENKYNFYKSLFHQKFSLRSTLNLFRGGASLKSHSRGSDAILYDPGFLTDYK